MRARAYAQELSERNLLALQHYQRCKAVGQFPDDALVRRNAAIIAGVFQSVEEGRLDSFLRLLCVKGKD